MSGGAYGSQPAYGQQPAYGGGRPSYGERPAYGEEPKPKPYDGGKKPYGETKPYGGKKPVKPYGDDREQCAITDPCSIAALIFIVVGFLGSGGMLIAAGTLLTETAPDFEAVRTTFAISAGFFFLAMIGHYLCYPDVLCGAERNMAYFGHMFILLGYIGVSGFMLGCAINMTASTLSTPVVGSVEAFAYLAGSFLIVFVVGWLIGNHEKLNCCECETFLVSTFGHYLIVVFLLIAAGLFFGFGDLFREGDLEEAGGLLLAVGACYILSSIGLLLINCC